MIIHGLVFRLLFQNQLPNTMAAKKTEKNTTETTPAQEGSPKPVAKKATTKTAKKAGARKASPVAAKKAAKTTPVKPSLDAIARAAYLNYRRRVEQGLPGDSHGDWLEAEKQAEELD